FQRAVLGIDFIDQMADFGEHLVAASSRNEVEQLGRHVASPCGRPRKEKTHAGGKLHDRAALGFGGINATRRSSVRAILVGAVVHLAGDAILDVVNALLSRLPLLTGSGQCTRLLSGGHLAICPTRRLARDLFVNRLAEQAVKLRDALLDGLWLIA